MTTNLPSQRANDRERARDREIELEKGEGGGGGISKGGNSFSLDQSESRGDSETNKFCLKEFWVREKRGEKKNNKFSNQTIIGPSKGQRHETVLFCTVRRKGQGKMKNYVICYGLISDEYQKFPLSITDPLVTANEILHFPHEVERFGTNNELNLQLVATILNKFWP